MIEKAERYNFVAMALHWVMAILFLGMLISGIVMTRDFVDPSVRFPIFQWHKSFGVCLLIAFFLRIGWRFFHKPPPMPHSMKPLEKRLAKLGHGGLYLWMLLVPLSGWAYVSASPYGIPTIVFGLFEWPHIPFIESGEEVGKRFSSAHEFMAFSFIALIAVHIAAVIKHQFFDKESIMRRMLPIVIGLVFLMPFQTGAEEYNIDYSQSEITFSGQHASKDFKGSFKTWDADIFFDRSDLPGSNIKATFDLSTAKTGDKLYDGTLPQSDWFDVKNYPQGIFESTSIIETEEKNIYRMTGNLTLRGIAQSLDFLFLLHDLGNDQVKAKAEFLINRLDYDIGKKSDPTADWVSEDITLNFTIIASP